MKKIILLLALVVCTINPAKAGEIVVIVNSESNVMTLSKRELIDLYMGKSLTFPNGLKTVTLDHNLESELRKQFYQLLVNKSVAQVNAYWARLLFTGRAKPPTEIASSEQVKLFVRENINAIGYIDSGLLDSSVKEVFRVE
jgi:ABC-type phosphate transport system substrate-binding protein